MSEFQLQNEYGKEEQFISTGVHHILDTIVEANKKMECIRHT